MDLSFSDLRCPIPVLFLIVLLPKWPPSKRQRAVSLGWGVGTVTTNGLNRSLTYGTLLDVLW